MKLNNSKNTDVFNYEFLMKFHWVKNPQKIQMSLIIINNKKFHLTFQEIFQQVKIPKYSVIIALSPIDI